MIKIYDMPICLYTYIHKLNSNFPQTTNLTTKVNGKSPTWIMAFWDAISLKDKRHVHTGGVQSWAVQLREIHPPFSRDHQPVEICEKTKGHEK